MNIPIPPEFRDVDPTRDIEELHQEFLIRCDQRKRELYYQALEEVRSTHPHPSDWIAVYTGSERGAVIVMDVVSLYASLCNKEW